MEPQGSKRHSLMCGIMYVDVSCIYLFFSVSLDGWEHKQSLLSITHLQLFFHYYIPKLYFILLENWSNFYNTILSILHTNSFHLGILCFDPYSLVNLWMYSIHMTFCIEIRELITYTLSLNTALRRIKTSFDTNNFKKFD